MLLLHVDPGKNAQSHSLSQPSSERLRGKRYQSTFIVDTTLPSSPPSNLSYPSPHPKNQPQCLRLTSVSTGKHHQSFSAAPSRLRSSSWRSLRSLFRLHAACTSKHRVAPRLLSQASVGSGHSALDIDCWLVTAPSPAMMRRCATKPGEAALRRARVACIIRLKQRCIAKSMTP